LDERLNFAVKSGSGRIVEFLSMQPYGINEARAELILIVKFSDAALIDVHEIFSA
jgi:hypothetical protein